MIMALGPIGGDVNLVETCVGRSSQIGIFVPILFRYETKQQLVNTSQLVRRRGRLDQTGANTDEVRKQGSRVHRRRIVENPGPDAGSDSRRCVSTRSWTARTTGSENAQARMATSRSGR
jgi:hypothetical protein